MRKEKSVEKLECILSDPDKLNYSKKLSDAITNVRNLENGLKSFTIQTKAEIQVNEEQITLLATALSTGKEYRDVNCKIVYNLDSAEKSWIRLDTGEVVKTETMTAEELQEELPLERPGTIPDEAAGKPGDENAPGAAPKENS